MPDSPAPDALDFAGELTRLRDALELIEATGITWSLERGEVYWRNLTMRPALFKEVKP